MSAHKPTIHPADLPEFKKLAKAFRQRSGLVLARIDLDGRYLTGEPAVCAKCQDRRPCLADRSEAIDEALRWGEPCIRFCRQGYYLWGLPVMINAAVAGGLLVAGVPLPTSNDEKSGSSPAAIRAASLALLELAVKQNLTNGALLQIHRDAAAEQRRRAEAIQAVKEQSYDSIRSLYLREEPGLLTAVRQGDRAKGREIINRVLVGIYHLAGTRLDLLKSFVLELIVMMSRAAVEAGGDPARILGTDYGSVAALDSVADEEALCRWLTNMLERIMDAIHDNRKYPNSVMVSRALRHMERHCHEELSRDETARIACLSPSHFSRLLRQKTGHTFSDLLNQMRVNRACALLRQTDKSLVHIALECGFRDQSYFTKVFRRLTSKTPREFRIKLG
jgi:AraC-like DNA-binding protein